MCNMCRVIFVGLTLSIFNSFAFSQNISIYSSVDKNTVSVGEQINFQVTVSGDISDIPAPTLPPLDDFSVYQAGRSQNISIINGRVSSSVTFNYALVPRKVGKFEIGSASINYKGQEYKTQPIQIEVVQQTQLPAQKQPQVHKDIYRGSKRDIFIETLVDKKTAYVNEQITLTFRFYRRINLLSQPQYQPPSTTGFMTEDLPPQTNYYTIIDGQRYLVTEIKTALFPISSGILTIGKAILECTIEDFPSPSDFFDDDFFRKFFSEGRTITLQSEPINIQVLKLPESDKPKDFSGAVGKYEIKSFVDKTEVEVGQPITLTVTISGVGNVKTITEPKISVENFRKYDTVSSFNIDKKNYVISGSKTFKTVLIPEVPGKLVIPSIEYTYFSPDEKSYKTVKTAPITLSVKPSPVGSVQVSKRPETKDMRVLSEDIRYIHTKLSDMKKISEKNNKIPWIWVFQFVPLILFFSYWQYNSYKQHLSTNVQFFRMKSAYKNADKKIRNLKKQINKRDIQIETISSAIFDILVNYLADKLGYSAEGITFEEISKSLTDKMIKPEKIDEIKSLWEEINFVQYAPSKVDNLKIKELVDKLENVIKDLEKYLS